MTSRLADWLRRQPDDVLVELLQSRPDLAIPAPAHLDALATRAAMPGSLQRALERLDAFALQLLDAFAIGGDRPLTPAGIAALLGADDTAGAVQQGLERLRLQALLLDAGDGALRPLPALVELLGPHPAGLGRPAAVLLAAVPEAVIRPIAQTLGLPATHHPATAIAAHLTRTAPVLLAHGSAAARQVLARLAAGHPVGTVRDARRPTTGHPDPEAAPIRWLLAHGLLVPISDTEVELPREIGLVLRGDRPLGSSQHRPPVMATTAVGVDAVNAAAAAQAATAVRRMERLLDGYTSEPPMQLRGGGLGVRELRRTAQLLGVTAQLAAMYVEVAAHCTLLAGGGGARLLPAVDVERWRQQPPEQRWWSLATAWLALPRFPALAGERDARGRAAPLSPATHRSEAAQLRHRVLELLAALAEGEAPTLPAVAAALSWQAPRWGAQEQRDRAAGWVLAEAEELGVTGRGALAQIGRALQRGDDPRPVLRRWLPEPVRQLFLQADLTAVAPGPLAPEVARELSLVADVESSGGATVYRFSEQSIRRALDAGQDAEALHQLLSSCSRTPIPQALAFLVDDVARRHGLLRAGDAGSYLRSSDETLLAEAVADRRLESLGLRLLAPTVAVSPAPRRLLLAELRSAGYAPATEVDAAEVDATEGAVATVRGRQASEAEAAGTDTDTGTEAAVPDGDAGSPPPRQRQDTAREAVRRLRAGERARRRGAQPVSATAGSTASRLLTVLDEAVRNHRTLWLSYVDVDGTGTERVVEPDRLAGGYLRAFDHLDAGVRTFAVHRITAAAVVPPREHPVPEPAE